MKPGERVDRYVIESELGRGGMGEVYEALDTRLARKVALKLVLAGEDPTTSQRTLREARAAAAFQHPNAVVVYDVGEADGATYIAMELVRGKTLRRFLGDESVPIERRLRWLVDVAHALAAAHDAGLVHRDVKPDNVMLRDDGAVKVLDFGIARRPARAVDPSAPTEADALPTLTERGMVVGTPLYASPEQLRGEPLDGRSDQFSWGVLAYELLTGKPPWRGTGDALAILSQVLSGEPPALAASAPAVPAEVAAAVHKTLAKAPAERFSDMRAAADAIEPFAEAPATIARPPHGSSTSAKAATPPATQVSRIARRTGRVVFIGLAVIGALLVGAIVFGALFGTLQWTRTKGSASASAVVASDGEIASLACSAATVEVLTDGAANKDPKQLAQDKELMEKAIGYGACARLAIELDVDWLLEGGQTPANVKAKLGKTAEVTLTVQGKSATGHGATPVDAINAATAELARKVKAVPPTPEHIKAWGAKDGASAVRIERVWRRIVLDLVPNHMVTIRELLQSDPESAWPHVFAALTFEHGGAEQEAERKKALEMAKTLPPSRALGVEGILELIGGEHGLEKAMAKLQKAYGQAPSDADIAGLFAAAAIATGDETGWSVLDRLVASSPTKSVVPLENAISAPRDRDLDRDGRYLAKLNAILPETIAWGHSVRHLAQLGKIDEARKALAFGDRFGLSAGDAAELDETRLLVARVAEDPKEVRAVASKLLGDPRPAVAASGAAANIWSDWIEGKFDDALDAQRRQIDRIRSHAGPEQVVEEVLTYAVILRRLGKKPPDASLLEIGKRALDEAKLFTDAQRATLKALFTLATFDDPAKAKATLAPTLTEIERLAAAAPNRTRRESGRLAAIVLVRVAKGDAEAAQLWRDTPHADQWTRDAAALEAGCALEHAGARSEAEQAFLIAAGPFGASAPLSKMIAHIRLAELYAATGRPERAKEHETAVDRAWKDVDPALMERFKKL